MAFLAAVADFPDALGGAAAGRWGGAGVPTDAVGRPGVTAQELTRLGG